MEIERINENTVKFFLSYMDIEERGFTREEVWYNREKSEELFWDMMDEINDEAEFEAEGPLWIQVHAKKNGIEVTVTRANTADGQLGESPFGSDAEHDVFHDIGGGSFQSMEDILSATENNVEWMENTFEFNEFENVIQLASRMRHYEAKTSLYSYNNKYYLHVVFDSEQMDDKEKTNMFSVLSEFGVPTKTTIHLLEEYGHIIVESDVFTQITKYF
ncbi:adaptor protein MecA [Sporosarcina sp. 6E9]|uniref:adaptor protein MecA n=1 Tax=Sporosarcina sp. 6E9 TaxID=2819235 RepID=UPI001B3085EF|nr:adaptor protein MecA [Sporosarcina sp. 6E9]